ncbi:MAG: hypothetical protein ACI4RN_06950, partial [Oscillospiraceae bacterium]
MTESKIVRKAVAMIASVALLFTSLSIDALPFAQDIAKNAIVSAEESEDSTVTDDNSSKSDLTPTKSNVSTNYNITITKKINTTNDDIDSSSVSDLSSDSESETPDNTSFSNTVTEYTVSFDGLESDFFKVSYKKESESEYTLLAIENPLVIDPGDSIKLELTEKGNKAFSNAVFGDGSQLLTFEPDNFTFNDSGMASLEINCKLKEYSFSPINMTVTRADGTEGTNYQYGEKIVVTPDKNYKVNDKTEQFLYTVEGEIDLTAKKYIFSIINNNSDIVTVKPSSAKADDEIEISVKENYKVKYFVEKPNGSKITVTDNKFTMPESDVCIQVENISYKVSVSENAKDYVKISGVNTQGYAQKNATIKVEPTKKLDGYHYTLSCLDNKGNNVNIAENSFTMPEAPVTVSVENIEPIDFGTVSSDFGEVKGNPVEGFTIKPKSGF